MVRTSIRGREAHYQVLPEGLSPARDWFSAFDGMIEGSLDRLKALVEAEVAPAVEQRPGPATP